MTAWQQKINAEDGTDHEVNLDKIRKTSLAAEDVVPPVKRPKSEGNRIKRPQSSYGVIFALPPPATETTNSPLLVTWSHDRTTGHQEWTTGHLQTFMLTHSCRRLLLTAYPIVILLVPITYCMQNICVKSCYSLPKLLFICVIYFLSERRPVRRRGELLPRAARLAHHQDQLVRAGPAAAVQVGLRRLHGLRRVPPIQVRK